MEEKEQKPKVAGESQSNALSFKVNGSKVSVPLQGSTLIAVLAIGYQSFVAFGSMQLDVKSMTGSMVQVEETIDQMKDDLVETNRTVSENSKARNEIAVIRAEHREETAKLESRIETLEKCVRKPRSCDI